MARHEHKRHIVRYLSIGAGGTLGAIITAAMVAGGSGSKPAAAVAPTAVAPASTAPAAHASASPAGYPPVTPAAHADKMTFTVRGTGYPSVTYGTDSDNNTVAGGYGTLGDGVRIPWTASLDFSGRALYYNVTAQLEDGGGNITCTITVSGPGIRTQVIATGHASGNYAICSAQAAPDSTGTWTQE